MSILVSDLNEKLVKRGKKPVINQSLFLECLIQINNQKEKKK